MTDVPEELVGKYDVVHIRLFIFVVPMEEGPKSILEKLVKLLSKLLSHRTDPPCIFHLFDDEHWRTSI